MKELPVVTYKEKQEGPIGALVINGLALPRGPQFFDPLAKIWSSCRKRIREQFGLDVAGFFVYDEEVSVVSCSFYLSFTVPESKNTDPKLYTKRFEETFDHQMMMFEGAIEGFLLDEEGYEAYIDLIESGNTEKSAYDGLFDRLLKRLNLKTKEDERQKRTKKDKMQAAVKKTKRTK